jgi:probable HAF family extracellular repeat protein
MQRQMKLSSILLATIPWLVLAPTSRAASYYEVTDLGTLNGDFCGGFVGRNSFATAINEAGQVVGGSCAFAGFFQRVTHAVSWSAGVITDLGTLGLGDERSPDQSVAFAVNNSGQVVGQNFFGFQGGTAVLWSGGAPASLEGVLGGFSSALDINDAGQIVGLRGSPSDFSSWSAFLYDSVSGLAVELPGLGDPFRAAGAAINEAGDVAGYASPSPNVFHATKWTAQVPADLGTLGGTHSFARAINATGHVAGESWMPGDFSTHAFLWREGAMEDLGTLGGIHSSAAGMDDAGRVVGTAGTPDAGNHAFLFEDGVMADLNERISPLSGWLLLEATALNSSGAIVGTGSINNETHAFLLTPAEPPPDTIPPIITVPGSMTVEAPSADGAVVFYSVTAVDDVDHHPILACLPASGSLFPVGTSTVECIATDNTGKSASASFSVTVLPPFAVSLEVARKHPVNPKTGVVTLSGSLSCNRDVFVFVNGQLTETVAGRATLQGFFSTGFVCAGPTTTWTTTVVASNGRFGAGPAEVSVFASGCSSSCASDEATGRVLLYGSR